METNKKGISLIVLVITIVVMIILATTIILSLTSNDIVDSAREATDANNLANAKQLVMVAEAEWEMEPEDGTFVDYAKEKLQAAGFNIGGGTGSIEVTEDAKVYVYPVIPTGYTASKATGESKVSEGLVIYETTTTVTDAIVESARKSYNQYVWIPVPNIDSFVRVNWKIGLSDAEFESITSFDASIPEETVQYSEMIDSITKYGGFYIARYETGIGNANTPVSKMGVDVYNNIDWAEAKEKAATLTSNKAVSHLIYGEEWDATLNFISETDSTYVTNSTEQGNYTDDLIKTGEVSKYAVNNIYDMAGNVSEMTAESAGYSSFLDVWLCTIRGGNCNCGTNISPVCFRGNWSTTLKSGNVGFRMALYMK